MASYSIYSQTLPSGATQSSETLTFDYGVQFSITESGCQLAGYYYYLASSGSTTGSNYTFRLFTTTNGTSGSLVSSSTVTGSGTWTAGSWVYTALGSPIALTNGTTYVASISWAATTYIEFTYQYYSATGGGSGGLTSGPISVPAASTALGNNQCSYNAPSSGTMPASGSPSDDMYAIDINVTTTAGGGGMKMALFP